MACLKKHGTEIGRITFTTTQKAYMSDGSILKRVGGDWKLWGKCKVAPEQAYAAAIENQQKVLSRRPALVAYRKELHAIAGLGKAWKIDLAISMMPDDPDGVWSEACDGYGDNVHADIDDVSKLCNLWKSASEESAELKRQAATV